MAKWVNVNATDALLNYIKTNCTVLSACATQPTDGTQCATTYALGTLGYTTTNITLAAGDAANSRKITAAAATIAVAATGTVSHFGFTNIGTLLAVATCVPTSVTSGGTVIMSAFDIDEVGTIT